jgi:hypothetical protein
MINDEDKEGKERLADATIYGLVTAGIGWFLVMSSGIGPDLVNSTGWVSLICLIPFVIGIPVGVVTWLHPTAMKKLANLIGWFAILLLPPTFAEAMSGGESHVFPVIWILVVLALTFGPRLRKTRKN